MKRKITLTESELVELINKIVSEQEVSEILGFGDKKKTEKKCEEIKQTLIEKVKEKKDELKEELENLFENSKMVKKYTSKDSKEDLTEEDYDKLVNKIFNPNIEALLKRAKGSKCKGEFKIEVSSNNKAIVTWHGSEGSGSVTSGFPGGSGW